MNKYTKYSLPLSIKRQKIIAEHSLILNPTENIPEESILTCCNFLHGYYISDTSRTQQEQKNSLIQFSGRSRATHDINMIYKTWASVLNAEGLSMRLLSGLHAHIILFMGIGSVGDVVVLLPESAGGHFATKNILKRLGYKVIELIIDSKNKCIDISASIKLIEKCKPKYLFIDRSEGLVYEDFSQLTQCSDMYSIFDASQYLTHILAQDYKSPFEMGFDLVISTIHKNFPGPQKAIVFTKKNDNHWQKVLQSMSQYVSSQHSFHTYSAGLALFDLQKITNTSSIMLHNSVMLSHELCKRGLPIVQINSNAIPTQHIWIHLNNKEKAFTFFKNMEKMRLLVNYRLLPYGLGYGIRIGLAAATNQGLRKHHIKLLSDYITQIFNGNTSLLLRHIIRELIFKIKQESK
jgi:glycine hydroxymethyltransferase